MAPKAKSTPKSPPSTPLQAQKSPSATPSVSYKLLTDRNQILTRPGELAGNIVTSIQEVWVAEDVSIDDEIAFTADTPSNDDNDSEDSPLSPLTSPKTTRRKASPKSSNPTPIVDRGDGMVTKISRQKVLYNAVLVHICKEVFDNVIDNYFRSLDSDLPLKKMTVDIDSDTGRVTVWNDGVPIQVRIHEWTEDEKRLDGEHYDASLIFGHLNSSSTYDDNKETGGRMGLGLHGKGAKLTNIFSTEFEIETADGSKKLVQRWTENMKHVGKPKVTSCATKGYTKVSFIPDFERFGLKGFTPEILAVIRKICIDASMNMPGVKVILNGESLVTKSLKDYTKYYYPTLVNLRSMSFKTVDSEVILVQKPPGDRGLTAISFANGACTTNGGIHVDKWLDAIFKPLVAAVRDKFKTKYQKKNLFNYFCIVIKANLINPQFDGNTKRILNEPAPTTAVTDKQIKDLMKWEFIEEIGRSLLAMGIKDLSKIDGKKNLFDIPEKATDAKYAGTAQSRDCILLITEGDSAKTMAIKGINKMENGYHYYGAISVFGKILNVRHMDLTNPKHKAQFLKNKEIANLNMMLGLKNGTDYSIDSNFNTLRYGRALMLTDADVDGYHIKGLIMNYFMLFYPSLVERGFLCTIRTPIVKVTQNKKTLSFYRVKDFEKWKEANGESKRFTSKYYKGLGTSTDKEIYEWFTTPVEVDYLMDDHANESIDLVFHKDRSNDRKKWLNTHNTHDNEPECSKVKGVEQMPITTFVNTELIEYSVESNTRCVPSVIDGYKDVQRKVMWAALKTLRGETKVAQFGAEAAKISEYTHGEQSIANAIVAMAQSFIGSNNLPLLAEIGQFGSRLLGGKDAASSRYIFTDLNALARKVFRDEDSPVLTYRKVDDAEVEPEFYVPIVPLLLINGTEGIGTGYSSTVPQHDPIDLIGRIKKWLAGTTISDLESKSPILPWYRGFKGTIAKNPDPKFKGKQIVYTGKFEEMYSTTAKKSERIGYRITELPIGTWTQPYVDKLKKYFLDESRKWIKTHKDISTGPSATDGNIDIEITSKYAFTEDQLMLKSTSSTNNMVAFNREGKIVRYATQSDILEEFCEVRLDYYKKRIARRITDLRAELPEIASKIKFIEEVLEDVELLKQTEEELFEYFHATGDYYCKKVEINSRKQTISIEDADDSNDSNDGAISSEVARGYKYLTDMPVRSMTVKKLAELKAKYQKIKDEIDYLEKAKPADIWIKELDEFVVEYKKWLVEMAKIEKEASKKTKRTKKLRS